VAYPGGEVGDLKEALAALYALVGAPTDRQLENYASFAGHQLPRATANTVRHGRGTPRWETVEAFVAACKGCIFLTGINMPSFRVETARAGRVRGSSGISCVTFRD